jgi:uncharacterized protein
VRVLDVNVVVAAHRVDHSHFESARSWLDSLLRAGERFSVPDPVAGAVVRLLTNRRMFFEPTPVPDAFAYLRTLREQPRHIRLAPGPGHLDIFEELCRTGDATGDLVPDAQLAALAIEHGAQVVSFDRDFARFPGLRWSLPE